jgi:hypothetical protein
LHQLEVQFVDVVLVAIDALEDIEELGIGDPSVPRVGIAFPRVVGI